MAIEKREVHFSIEVDRQTDILTLKITGTGIDLITSRQIIQVQAIIEVFAGYMVSISEDVQYKQVQLINTTPLKTTKIIPNDN